MAGEVRPSTGTSVKRPLVSVVTPSLNQGRFLADALDSVIAQQHPAIEHIVVEGGSTDETATVLEEYTRRAHIRVIEDVPPRGQAAALNVGFRAARGEIIGWLNADDRYVPGAFAAATETLVGEVKLMYGDWQIIDELGAVIRSQVAGKFDRRDLLNGTGGTIGQPAVFFRRELFERIGYLDENLHYAMDYDFWLRAAEVTEFRRFAGTLAQFRHHPDSKTVDQPNRFYPEARRVARAHGGPFFSSLFRRRWLEAFMGRRLANHLIWHWTKGADSAAGREVVPAAERSPRCPLCRRGLLGGRP
jgi:glycosyltransferase involved in cell wall biosynthesis